MDKWEEMYSRQNDFQESVGMNDDASAETKELVLHVLSECDELLREFAWKAKRRQNITPIRSNVLTQIIDIFKLVVSMGCSWGFTADEMYEAFIEKSSVVEQLYRQEFPLYEIIRMGDPVVAIDIDGVLSDYPKCFYDWVAKETGKKQVRFDTLDPYDAFGGAISHAGLAALKDAYRQSGVKRGLPPLTGAVEFTHALRRKGYRIVLLSARPAREYTRIFADTIAWLDGNVFEYDAILWDERKETRLINEFQTGQVQAFIDDDARNIDRVSSSGVPSYLLSRPYNDLGYTFTQILDFLGG